MNRDRIHEAHRQLQALDDRMTYHIRPRAGALHRASPDELERKLRDLAGYTVELKEVLAQVLRALDETASGGASSS